VSIVVPVYNAKQHIRRLLESIYQSTYSNFEIVVVDDASTDKSLELITTEFHGITVFRNETNRGKSWSLNRGITSSRGEFVIVTDPDLIFHANLIEKWVNVLIQNRKIGVCGCYVYYNDSKHLLTRAGARFDERRGAHYHPRLNIRLDYRDERYEESSSWVFDDLYIVRRSALQDVGGYDYQNFSTIYEEADLQLRISAAGYTKAVVPGARAYHAVPVETWSQLRRYSKYKLELLCRNRFILIRKLGLSTLPRTSAVLVRLFLFYTFVAFIQPVSLREKASLFKSVVRGISRGLFDPIITNSPESDY